MSRRIDFLRAPRERAIGWILLLAGAALLGTAILVDKRWSDERSVLEAAARTKRENERRALLAAARPPKLSDEDRRFLAITPQLRQPWLRTLRIIENASANPIYLLRLTIDPSTGLILLNAEASTFEDALTYVGALNEEGVLGPAQLRSHEQTADPAGRALVRFAVETRWVQ